MNILCCLQPLYLQTPVNNNNIYTKHNPGILYISTILKENRFNVFTLNLLSSIDIKLDIINSIKKNNINIFMCGGWVTNLASIKNVIDIVKDYDNHIITIVGGPLITNSSIEAMQLISSIDYGVIGEGELTSLKLCSALIQNKNIENVPGIVYRKNNRFIFTEQNNKTVDLNRLPFVNENDFNLLNIRKNKYMMSISTSRSCPFNCTFCSKSIIKYKQRSLDSIFKEIDYTKQFRRIDYVLFVSEIFTTDIDWIIEFCNRIKKYHINWFIFLRVSQFITKEILLMMYDAGCQNIFYGSESADDKILKSMNKGITIAEIERVFEITINIGIKIGTTLIFGDKEEDDKTVYNTITWAKNHYDKLLDISYMPIILYPGSKIYNDAVKDKVIEPLEFIKNGCQPVNISKLSNEEYNYLINIELPRLNNLYSHDTLNVLY
jgi:radical SAM superfamily enzyme YgiQ (UPF0313 family)